VNGGACGVRPNYPVAVAIAFLAVVALVVLVDVVATRGRHRQASEPERISVDLRRRS